MNEAAMVEHGWVSEQCLVMNDSESSREKWVLTPGYRKTGKVPECDSSAALLFACCEALGRTLLVSVFSFQPRLI